MECGGSAAAFRFVCRKPQPFRSCRANSKAAALPPHSKKLLQAVGHVSGIVTCALHDVAWRC